MRNTIYNDAENLGLEPRYEAKSGKEPSMDQVLDICNRIYEIATYDLKMVCVTINKLSENKPPCIRFVFHSPKKFPA